MKLRNGTYYSDFYLPNGERVRRSLSTKDKAEAAKKERELQVLLESSPTMNHKSPSKAPNRASTRFSTCGVGVTLKEAFKRAMREHEPWRASASQITINGNYKFLSEYFKDETPLHEITDRAILEYSDSLRAAGKSPSTINQRLSLLSVLFKCSHRWPECQGLVVRPEIIRQKVRKGRIRVLPYEEEGTVVKWFKENRLGRVGASEMADFVVFLIDTGFRLTEGLTLRSADIQWEAGLVPAWDTKADHPRMVPMTSRVKAILDARKGRAVPFAPLTKDSADDIWAAMREVLGYNIKADPEFVIHALRHTCASRLAAAGMDAFRIQKWMGHKSIQTTLKYVTLFAPDLAPLADTLDARRLEAAAKAAVLVPSGVPSSVPKVEGNVVDAPSREGRKMPTTRGTRPIHRTYPPVDNGLLIRRSLVRAQVGEPEYTRV